MTLPRSIFVAALSIAILSCAGAVVAPLDAQVTGASPVLATPPAAAQGTNGHLDPEVATQAYLATLPADKKAKSDAYFEGGYWLILWDFVVSAVVFLILLGTGLSARMRNAAERMTGSATLQSVVYWVMFIVLVSVIQLPWSIYEGFVREHAYGLSNLTFGAWLGEQVKGLAIALVLGAILIAVLYAIVRRLPRTWWVWGAIAAIAFVFFGAVIAPVVLTPIFNSPKKLTDQRVVAPILRLARQNGIDAKDVWEIDASKQSKRISANVSGALGTERITLNDNLLNRASLEEIEAVMGHEMGHYVLEPRLQGADRVRHSHRDRLCGGGVAVRAPARAIRALVEGARHRGPGGTPARGAPLFRLFLRGDAGAEHDRAHAGVRGGRLRLEHGATAGWLRADRDQAQRIPQARSGAVGGKDLLRPPERAHAHFHGDALEGGEPARHERRYDTFRVFRFRKSMRMN